MNNTPTTTAFVAPGYILTRREQFAMAAMAGLCANSDPHIASAKAEVVAGWAVFQADALIAELDKQVAE